MNLCEHIFNGSVSMVNRAYWTKDIKLINNKLVKNVALETVIEKQINDLENYVVDITEQIQHSFINYFSVFGTKVIDFNPLTSAFCNLKDLVGQNAAQALLTASKAQSFKIILFLVANDERFTFEV